jgi:hypothetical protein
MKSGIAQFLFANGQDIIAPPAGTSFALDGFDSPHDFFACDFLSARRFH